MNFICQHANILAIKKSILKNILNQASDGDKIHLFSLPKGARNIHLYVGGEYVTVEYDMKETAPVKIDIGEPEDGMLPEEKKVSADAKVGLNLDIHIECCSCGQREEAKGDLVPGDR